MELTVKQEKFVQEFLINGYNGKRAYMKAYNTENENMASVEAHKLLKMPKIKKALDEEEGGFKELARVYNADKKAIVKKLSEIIFDKKEIKTDNGDIKVERQEKDVLNAINLLMKLTGDFAPEKREVTIEEQSTIDVKNMSREDLETARKELLANM